MYHISDCCAGLRPVVHLESITCVAECGLALSMTQLSEPGWAEDTPPLSLLLCPSHFTHPTLQWYCRGISPSPPHHVTIAPAGGMQGSKSLLNQLEPAQPSPAWISSSGSSSRSHLSLHRFLHIYLGVYLLGLRAWQPQHCSKWVTRATIPPCWWECQCHDEETKPIYASVSV